MGAYKAATMKRHIAWSNCKSVECLNLGVMTREMQRRFFAHAPKSAKSYKSRDGKTSYVGTKFLKHTQILVLVFQWYTISGYCCVFVCVSTPESPTHYIWSLSTTLGCLRTYPPRFGLRLVHLYPRFCQKKEALPVSNEPIEDSFTLFSKVEWGDWWDFHSANMQSVFVYLRGSKDLELGEWRPLFPSHI